MLAQGYGQITAIDAPRSLLPSIMMDVDSRRPSEDRKRSVEELSAENGLDVAQTRMLRALSQLQAEKLEPIKQDIKEVKDRTTALDSTVFQMQAQLRAVNVRVQVLETQRQPVSSGASTADPWARFAPGSSGDQSHPAGSLGPNRDNRYAAPVAERKTVCIGGFDYNEGSAIKDELTQLLRGVAGIQDIHPIGSYCQRARLVFITKDHMWQWMKDMKGKKLESTLADPTRDPGLQPGTFKLWHNIDRSIEEVQQSVLVGHARKLLLDAINRELTQPLSTDASFKAIDMRADRGIVVIQPKHLVGLSVDVAHRRPFPVFTKSPYAKDLELHPKANDNLGAVGLRLRINETFLSNANTPPSRG